MPNVHVDVQLVTNQSQPNIPASGGTASLSAQAPTGYIVIGGGFDYAPAFLDLDVHTSRPSATLDEWQVTLVNSSSGTLHSPIFTVYAICVPGA